MKTIYLDSDFRCYTEAAEGLRAVETMAFDGKCTEFIDGYRYVPEGESWTREDGEVFEGEMISPWKSYDLLDEAQREYERQLLAEYTEALKTVGVEV